MTCRLLRSLALILLLAGSAFAVSDQPTVLIGTAPNTPLALTGTGTVTGNAFCFNQRASEYVFTADSDAVSGTTPTLDIKIQESDGKSTWVDVVAFTQVTTTDYYEKISITSVNYLRCFRAVVVKGGTSPVYNLTVKAYVRDRQ